MTAPARPAGSGLEVLPVVEVFGPTFQGEGPSAGRVAVFVRLGGCNLSCVWCDTPYTWDARRYRLREEIRPVPVTEVVGCLTAAAAAVDRPLLVLTGGEPLLHQQRPAFRSLLAAAAHLGLTTEIETNATRIPAPDLPGGPVLNASPKLSHAGDPRSRRIVPAAMSALADLARAGRARFKFVAAGTPDLAEVESLVSEYGLPGHSVWVMPQGTNSAAVLSTARVLADPVLAHGWNLTLRTHTLLWDDERRR